MKNKKKLSAILAVVLAIPLFIAGATVLNNTNLKDLFANEKDKIVMAGDTQSKTSDYKTKLKQAKVSEDSRYYKYVAPSTEKEGKDASINAIHDTIEVNGKQVEVINATSEAVEATPSKEDKTIVEYKKEDISTVKADGTTKTETEIAKEVVNNAIEDSKKDDTVIIAVKTETVENAVKTETVENAVKTETKQDNGIIVDSIGDLNPSSEENISFEDDGPILEPVEEIKASDLIADGLDFSGDGSVIESCSDLVRDSFEDLDWN